jgi:sugar transferase (PEP-CTERM/EpsH1 system associated)
LQILFLAQRVPFPPNRGDKITTYHQIRHLSREHDIFVACLADGVEDLHHGGGLKPFVRALEAIPLGRARARMRALAAIGTRTPLTVAYFGEPALHERIRALIRSHSFDLIIAYSSSMAQYVEEFDDVPRIMQFADLDSMKWRLYAEHHPPPRRWIYALEADRLLRYERAIGTTFSHSLLCTPQEVDDFRRLIPGGRVSLVGNGVDLEYFRPSDNAKASSLAFVGVLDYFPNVDAVVWFCHEIFPLIRNQVPEATFTICGSRPTEAVRHLGHMPGVVVTGAVPDIRPYLSTAAVGVVPLRIARGIQNKLLEAMAMGLPVVTTSAAFKGVAAVRDRDLLVADEPAAFAESVVRLLRDERLRREMGRSARETTERNYSWERAYSQLEEVVASVTGRGASSRAEMAPARE